MVLTKEIKNKLDSIVLVMQQGLQKEVEASRQESRVQGKWHAYALAIYEINKAFGTRYETSPEAVAGDYVYTGMPLRKIIERGG